MAAAVENPPPTYHNDEQLRPIDPSSSTTPPPVHLHCSDALEAELTVDEQGERAKAVMQSAPRMPAVGFHGRYGDRWYIDMISLTHNAVRRQLFDAFVMANALGKLLLDVSESDLARVYAWLGTLESFVKVVFEIQDEFIYPLIDLHMKSATGVDGRPLHLPELLSIPGRKQAKSHVLDLLLDARKTRDVATGETIAKINALRYALDQFGANILDYFKEMEKFVPKLLKKAIRRNGEKEKNKLERRIFEYVLKQPSQGAMLAALLTQCIESRNRRREFIERNIKKEKLRMQFKLHIKSVEATHMQLARTFDQVATDYEKKFNVKTFVRQYDAANDAEQTAKMFGDVDINYEPLLDDDNNHSNVVNGDGQGVHEPRTELLEHDDDGVGQNAAVGLDDDIIEVHAPEDFVEDEGAGEAEDKDEEIMNVDEDDYEYEGEELQTADETDFQDEIEVRVPATSNTRQ